MSARSQHVSTSPVALLSRLLSKLDLTPTQRVDLKKSYKAVTDVLLNSDALENILHELDLRPQGSVRAGTVVRPRGKVDFDLDILCWMVFMNPRRTPSEVWQLVWNALGEHETYRAMRESKPRCIRLNFAAQYHLDITPAIPDPARPAPVLWVPDKKMQEWSPSNPIGFCDGWLQKIAAKLPSTITTFSAERILKNDWIVANRQDTVEPLPDEDGFNKAPLLKLIQLVKYLRDEGYEQADSDRPSSILLTTITARSYEKALYAGLSSLSQFLVAVVSNLKAQVSVSQVNGEYKFLVVNPVDERENFAEKWSLKTYGSFCRWADALGQQIKAIMNTETDGIDSRLRVFNATIPGASRFALEKEIPEEVRRQHDSGKLRLEAIPSVASSSILIRPTTFFGKP